MPAPLDRPAATTPPSRRQRLPGKIRPRWQAALVVAAGLVAIAAVLFAVRRDQAGPPADAATATAEPGDLALGQSIFAAQCVACHGAGGKGDGPAAAGLNPAPVDFTSAIHRGHRREDQIAWVTNGLPPSAMPAFGGNLTPAEIAAVVDYIRSLGAAASADGTIDTPGPALCTVDPTDPATLRTAPLDAPAAAPDPAAPVGPDFPWPRGEPASRAEIDGVTAAIRLFVACGNAGDQQRRLSLYSKHYIGAQFDAMSADAWQQLLTFAHTAPTPLAANDQAGIRVLDLFQRLPDGRVGAYSSIIDPVNHPHETDVVVIFVRQGDRWVIDEIHGDPNGVLLATPTPEPTFVPASLVAAGAALNVGDLVVTVAETPTAPGAGTVTLAIVDARGQPVNDATVSFAVEMADMPMGIATGAAEPLGDGRYSLRSAFAMTGRWQIRGAIVREGAAPLSFGFDIEIPAS